MVQRLFRNFISRRLDGPLLGAVLPLVGAGLITMSAFTEENYFVGRQLIWLAAAFLVYLVFSFIDWRFLRRSGVLVVLFFASCATLFLLMSAGQTFRGAQSWFSWGGVSLQPADFIKLILILLLAKYFSRRHIEIAQFRHIIVSGTYALIPFLLILIQPDFGSALVFFLIWLGLVVFAGISKKHLLAVFAVAILGGIILWTSVFAPYQKARIITFLHPLADIRGAGYSSFQSTIAVGSGRVWGKGVGYGTQSRLKFLPEYQTDFIFAAFAEEWGFVGVLLFFFFFGLLIWRILKIAMLGETNFETLFGVGLALFFMSHFIINVGMNLGFLPVTGLTLPFVSYGGSHLLAEFAGLGILTGMRAYNRAYHRDDMRNEFLGVA